MEYLIEYDEIKSLKLSEISEFIKNRRKPLNSFLLKDFVFFKENPIFPGNGVYIFYDFIESKFIYVGKCSVRTFAERIPSHFDLRYGGWFNTMLKLLLKQNDLEKTDENIQKYARYSFDRFSLTLIHFPTEIVVDENFKIERLESILRVELTPLNLSKHKIDNFLLLEEALN
jgi:hypothetical protein